MGWSGEDLSTSGAPARSDVGSAVGALVWRARRCGRHLSTGSREWCGVDDGPSRSAKFGKNMKRRYQVRRIVVDRTVQNTEQKGSKGKMKPWEVLKNDPAKGSKVFENPTPRADSLKSWEGGRVFGSVQTRFGRKRICKRSLNRGFFARSWRLRCIPLPAAFANQVGLLASPLSAMLRMNLRFG